MKKECQKCIFQQSGDLNLKNHHRDSKLSKMGKKGKIALDEIACMKTTYVWVRSSRPEVFCKKDVLGNFTKFKGKTPSPESLFW